ncbi:MAG: hypothetical protein F4X26_06605 [Chloroflexi bacterium]|nr:hypothetical protein [Chloroflexota bacterium]
MLLVEPYPENLPTIEVCRECNASFSRDEEYFGAFLASVLTGSVNPDPKDFPRVARSLARSGGLRKRIERAGSRQLDLWGGVEILWEPELDRLERVVLKNARGHAFFETGEPATNQPTHMACVPIARLSEADWSNFQELPVPQVWPEVGSRMFQRGLHT